LVYADLQHTYVVKNMGQQQLWSCLLDWASEKDLAALKYTCQRHSSHCSFDHTNNKYCECLSAVVF